jgi:hypothetical protein
VVSYFIVDLELQEGFQNDLINDKVDGWGKPKAHETPGFESNPTDHLAST